jgi:hypothetical protein
LGGKFKTFTFAYTSGVTGSTYVLGMNISRDESAPKMTKYYSMNHAAGYSIVTLMDKDQIAALGASLRQIDQKLLTPGKEEGITRVWYQGGEPYFDVFVELRQGKIQWFQFTLRGKSISWNPEQSGWQSGTTNELRADDITFYPASKVIENDKHPDWEFIQLVRSILETRAGEDIFDQILALFDTEN